MLIIAPWTGSEELRMMARIMGTWKLVGLSSAEKGALSETNSRQLRNCLPGPWKHLCLNPMAPAALLGSWTAGLVTASGLSPGSGRLA